MALHPRLAVAVAAALVLVGGSGCALVRALGGGLQRPVLAYEGWSAGDLDLDGVTVTLRYRLENPNDIGLDLRTLSYRLEVEGQRVVDGDVAGGLQVPPRAAAPLAFPVRLRWRELPGFAELLRTRSEVGYRISGRAGVGSPLGTVELPFEHADRLALPRLPALRLGGVALRALSPAHLALELRLQIENPNAFPLPVGGLTYGLRVGGRDLVAGGAHPLAAVPPRGRATVAVPVEISLRGVADAAAELLRGAPLDLSGLAGFGAVEVPVRGQGSLER